MTPPLAKLPGMWYNQINLNPKGDTFMDTITPTARGELARANFLRGCNCAQAVLLAYSDRTGLDDDVAMRLASSFGGGMGRLREVCGTVSASLMVLGIVCGYSADSPNEKEEKAAHYARVQEYARRFRALHGSIICREILANHAAQLKQTDHTDTEQVAAMLSDNAVPTPRTDAYYSKRPCPRAAADAACLLEAYLQELEAAEQR